MEVTRTKLAKQLAAVPATQTNPRRTPSRRKWVQDMTTEEAEIDRVHDIIKLIPEIP